MNVGCDDVIQLKQRFVLTSLDSRQTIDPGLRFNGKSAKYQVIGC